MTEDSPRNNDFQATAVHIGQPDPETAGFSPVGDIILKRKRSPWAIFGAVGLLMVAVLSAWYFFSFRPEKKAAEELRQIAELAAPVIRAEELTEALLNEGRLRLESFKPASRAAEQMVQGALAFLDGDLRQADQRFSATQMMVPENPWPYSFLAVANLRQGNSALAAENYLQSLELKRSLNLSALDLSADQLGLALSYFMLHRTEEALNPATEAYRARLAALGPEDPATLSAANRLSAILVALGQKDEAEKLLKASYLAGLRGGGQTGAAAEESVLLLTVLLNQSGRLNELEEFLTLEEPAALAAAKSKELEEAELTAGFSPEKAKEPETPPPAGPEPQTPPPTAENLAAWERTARSLAGANDALAADLFLMVLKNRSANEHRDIFHPDYRPIYLDLVRAYMASGQYEQALAELKPLLEETPDHSSAEHKELIELMAESLEGKGSLKEAEMLWHGLAEPVDKRLAAVKNKKTPDPADVSLSLRLHLKLAENMLRQGRVPREAEIELRSALSRAGKSGAAVAPEAALVQLRLARLGWSLGETRSSADYYKNAINQAATLLKKDLDPEKKAVLTQVLEEATKEAEALKAKKEAPALSPAQALAATEEMPGPDLLRQELTALEALGRLAEFEARLEPVLKEAAAAFGPGSQGYMRYYSLKLKWLESSGRVDELTGELVAQADAPPGRNEMEKALNRGSALIYAARVNEASGRVREAGELYRKALQALSGYDNQTIIGRRQSVEEALKNLGQ